MAPALDLERVVVPIARVAVIPRAVRRVVHGGTDEWVDGPDKSQGFQGIPHRLRRQRIWVAAVLLFVILQRPR